MKPGGRFVDGHEQILLIGEQANGGAPRVAHHQRSGVEDDLVLGAKLTAGIAACKVRESDAGSIEWRKLDAASGKGSVQTDPIGVGGATAFRMATDPCLYRIAGRAAATGIAQILYLPLFQSAVLSTALRSLEK